MKKLLLSLHVVMVLFFISSCKKAETVTDSTADVYISSLTDHGQLAFSTIYSVISYNPISSVTVNIPGGYAFHLAALDAAGNAFFKDTSMAGAGFSHTPAAPSGVYNFHVTFSNGEEKLYTNTLSSDYLLPPTIDSLYKKPDGLSVRLKWNPVAGAQAYQVRVSSGQNVIVPWIELDDSSITVYERLITYFSHYLPGTLTFELRAVIYESSDHLQIQSISYATSSIDL